MTPPNPETETQPDKTPVETERKVVRYDIESMDTTQPPQHVVVEHDDGEYVSWVDYAALRQEVAKLQAFKDFVHRRLDEGGVPTNPSGEHTERGCRVGQRLKWIFDDLTTERTLRQAAEAAAAECKGVLELAKVQLTGTNFLSGGMSFREWKEKRDKALASTAGQSLLAEVEMHRDFLAFMRGELAKFSCCHESGEHEGTPPMMWPELICCIVKKSNLEAQATIAELQQRVKTLEGVLRSAVENAKDLNWSDHNSVFNYASHRKSEAALALLSTPAAPEGKEEPPTPDQTLNDPWFLAKRQAIQDEARMNAPTDGVTREADGLQSRILAWVTKTNEQMRLEMGELTSQECRSIRAAMNNLLAPFLACTTCSNVPKCKEKGYCTKLEALSTGMATAYDSTRGRSAS